MADIHLRHTFINLSLSIECVAILSESCRSTAITLISHDDVSLVIQCSVG